MAWLIILIAFWTYPIICYFIFHLTIKKSKLRKYIFKTCIVVSVLATLSLLTNISTTFPPLDWLLLTSLYFLLCLTLWWTQFQLNKIVKLVGLICMFIVFGLGYFSAIAGILGVGLVTAQYETDREVWLGDGLIYKENSLGNAISDYRGKEVEVYKTLSWLPIIEWRINDKSYYNVITYLNPLTVDYKPNEHKIYLSATMLWGKDKRTINWSDTLSLNSKTKDK
jgi:hypothetical protein